MRLLAILLCVCVVVGRTVGTAAEQPVPAGAATAPLVVMAWGNNGSGQLGDANAPTDTSIPGIVLGHGGLGHLDTVTAISAGEDHALALDRNGTVWAWGDNTDGQLGNGDMPTQQEIPVQVLDPSGNAPLDHVVAISAGTYHNLALRDDGTLWAWGRAAYGRLGDGQTDTNRDLPVQVVDEAGTGFMTDVVQIAAGYNHNLAMTADGAIYAWGRNEHGQVGQGKKTSEIMSVPVRVKDAAGTGFLGGVKSIVANSYSSYGLADNGTVWAWGNNEEGEIGDGTIEDRWLPVKVKGPGGNGELGNVKEIASGSYQVLVTLSDGTALAWGYNSDGQVGDGNLGQDALLPTPVMTASGPLTGVVTMSGGYLYSLALRLDGTVWSWGDDLQGQLGVGGGNDRDLAVQVKNRAGGFLTNVLDVGAGIDGYTSFALARTATVTLKAPATTRGATVAVTMIGSSVFGIDGYFIGESPVPPPAASAEWKSTPLVAYTIQAPGDGPKTLYAFTRDTEGFVSPAATATVRLDTTVPAIAFDLPPFNRAKQTTVKLRGSDAGGVAGYMVKSTAGRPSASATGWQATAPKSFTLSGSDGPKKLYAWVKDKAGNVSATKSDTTFLDTRKPGVTIRAPGKNAVLRKLLTITGRTVDAKPGSGVKSQRAAIQRKAGASCSWWDPKAQKLLSGACGIPQWFVLPAGERWAKEIGELSTAGSYTLYLEATDRASNRARVTRGFMIVAAGEAALFR